jgi:hypothetical protein
MEYNMKTLFSTAIVAIVVSVLTTWLMGGNGNKSNDAVAESMPTSNDQSSAQPSAINLSLSPEPEAAAWIRLNSMTAQSEQKILAPISNSACFLTHVEIRGIQSPTDHNACTITADDFTGYWQINATTGEGTQSELLCNARCLVWE